MNGYSLIDQRARELIAVGASVAANCLPCLRYHFAQARKAGCSLEDIEEATRIAEMVKSRPTNDMKKLVIELITHDRQDGEPGTSETIIPETVRGTE